MQAKVKIVATLLFCIIVVTEYSWAQLATIGFSIGPVYSSQKIKNTSGVPTANNYHSYSEAMVSIIGQYNIQKNFGLLFDVGYCNRGVSISQPVTVTTLDPTTYDTVLVNKKNSYQNNLAYLDNYLMAKYTYGNKVRVYADAGLYYSFLLKAKQYVSDEYYNYNTNAPSEAKGFYTDSITSSYRRSDFGLAVGLGIEYGRFGLDYRYSRSIMDISKSPGLATIHNSFSTVKLIFKFVKIQKEYFKDDE
ncbi:MAG TPA: porin family protein [Cytophagaceae bacterium]|jgi:hypothetical protein|nr:porin family protein [Cytophagaceae bacterium]